MSAKKSTRRKGKQPQTDSGIIETLEALDAIAKRATRRKAKTSPSVPAAPMAEAAARNSLRSLVEALHEQFFALHCAVRTMEDVVRREDTTDDMLWGTIAARTALDGLDQTRRQFDNVYSRLIAAAVKANELEAQT